MKGISDLVAWAREALLLSRAETRARAMSDEQRAAVRELADAAIARMDAASGAGAPGSTGTACALHRDAIVLLAAAHVRARDASARGEPSASLAVSELARHDELRDREALEEALPTTDLLAFDRLGASEAEAALERLDDAATRLLADLETRSPWSIRRARRARIALLTGAVLALLVLSLRGRGVSENVALHRPVSASSLDPGSPPVSALVDGDVHGAFGARTNPERSPWLLVDLEGAYTLDRIVVWNRGDGFPDESVPLVLEVSLDAQTFTQVARRTERFTQDDPWRVDSHGARGRYVRVRVDKIGSLALTEVEVFGRK